ncbi:hypothetical protein CALVIDRAFT_596357 [Calocera viscosa TUFC12733]|uniref:Ubiquitin-like protease family profile domain-containing protein n=1 Tax=Calocera viscosa (strain TUFC12733) TaxID=1330018 RepID=A0A167PEY8_CALVF|nr:hypothetical protein CALVIDRAFT_596357 [Calocera viscosa TUFC12733]
MLQLEVRMSNVQVQAPADVDMDEHVSTANPPASHVPAKTGMPSSPTGAPAVVAALSASPLVPAAAPAASTSVTPPVVPAKAGMPSSPTGAPAAVSALSASPLVPAAVPATSTSVAPAPPVVEVVQPAQPDPRPVSRLSVISMDSVDYGEYDCDYNEDMDVASGAHTDEVTAAPAEPVKATAPENRSASPVESLSSYREPSPQPLLPPPAASPSPTPQIQLSPLPSIAVPPPPRFFPQGAQPEGIYSVSVGAVGRGRQGPSANDCGVWAVSHMIAVLRGHNVSGMERQDMIPFRKYLFNHLAALPFNTNNTTTRTASA